MREHSILPNISKKELEGDRCIRSIKTVTGVE